MNTILNASAQQKILNEKEFLSAIVRYHPVAKQAAINVKISRSEILLQRGAFDPNLSTDIARKEFGNINYYDVRTTELKLPAWYGIDIYAGRERVDGARINPEKTTGSLTYLGVSIQPLQNILIDKRRAAVLRAKNLAQLSVVEQRIALNDLVQEALISYWDWWRTHRKLEVVQSALRNAERRMEMIRTAYQLGDRPAIDTLEALSQVQQFEVKLSAMQEDLRVAMLEVSVHLWNADGMQYELPHDATPEQGPASQQFTFDTMLAAAQDHPELLQFEYILRNGNIEKKLAAQSILPELSIKYNQTGYSLSKTVNAPWFDNNYRFGIGLTVPLLASEGRAKYQQAKFKIEKVQIEQSHKLVQINTRLSQYFEQWKQTEKQVQMQNRFLQNIAALQRGEEIKFQNGESSLFLVNAREQKTIEAKEKLIELEAKLQKTAIALRWSAGIY